MPGDRARDLSGRWIGIFDYPRNLPATRFDAILRDLDGAITGETVEPGQHGGTLHAMIEGQRSGDELRFTKVYDELPHAAHPIEYRGRIAPGGDEINGRWQIAGSWSGTFLMVREGRAEEKARLRVGAEA